MGGAFLIEARPSDATRPISATHRTSTAPLDPPPVAPHEVEEPPDRLDLRRGEVARPAELARRVRISLQPIPTIAGWRTRIGSRCGRDRQSATRQPRPIP